MTTPKGQGASADCTCRITGPAYEQTRIDSACPFHGEGGSMVATIKLPRVSERALDQAVQALDDHDYASLGREIGRLRVERDRYRQALEVIDMRLTTASGDNIPRGHAAVAAARGLARTALGRKS